MREIRWYGRVILDSTIPPIPLTPDSFSLGPAEKLCARRPLGRLMHPFVLSSMILQIFTQVGFQMGTFFFIRTLPEYKPIEHFKKPDWTPGVDVIKCFENTILFCFSNFQYVIVALVFSVGRPYRKEFYR